MRASSELFLPLESKIEEFFNANCFADTPFTIIVPKMNFDVSSMDKNMLKDLVFEHIIPGVQLKSLKNGETFSSLNHNAIRIKNSSPEKWTVNDLRVLKFISIPSKQISFLEIDGYLNDRKNSFAYQNVQENNR